MLWPGKSRRMADSKEEPRTSGAGQHESDGSTSVRVSTEDVVFQPDYPRVCAMLKPLHAQ
jgi:hypothetical protein